ncbi:MAG TPA: hypothetical protein VN278_01235 [Methanosarcina sp.]|nr:hypothetical protein [Methanosarcina sp.]
MTRKRGDDRIMKGQIKKAIKILSVVLFVVAMAASVVSVGAYGSGNGNGNGNFNFCSGNLIVVRLCTNRSSLEREKNRNCKTMHPKNWLHLLI